MPNLLHYLVKHDLNMTSRDHSSTPPDQIEAFKDLTLESKSGIEGSENIPTELQDQIMAYWMAKRHSVITVDSSEDLETHISEFESITTDSLHWRDVRGSIKFALYSTAVWSVGIAFKNPTIFTDEVAIITDEIPRSADEVIRIAQFPDALVNNLNLANLRHLEIPFRTSISHGAVNSIELIRARSGMESLATQLPNLDGFYIHLIIDVCNMEDSKAKRGDWDVLPSSYGVGSFTLGAPGSVPQFRNIWECIHSLLVAAKNCGPDNTKIFKLSVVRSQPTFEEQSIPGWHRGLWKPWALRCTGLEFQSLNDRLCRAVLQRAVNSSTEVLL